MKTSVIIFILIWSIQLGLSPITNAQYSEKEIAKKGYTTDGIINILIEHIPAGWKFTEDSNTFVFQRIDSIFDLTENKLNFLSEKKEDRIKRIQSKGEKTVSKIVIRYEIKWDFLKLQEAQLSNQSIYNEIRLLPEKYNILGLKDQNLSSKGNIVYTSKTDDDKNRISNYYSEKEELENKVIRIPDYSSQKYSLFDYFESGFNDNSHYIYPEEASNEFYQIKNLLREICGR